MSHRSGVKQFNHPVVGMLEVSFNNLTLPADAGLNMLINTPAPGSASEDGLRMLASWAATGSTAQADGASGSVTADDEHRVI